MTFQYSRRTFKRIFRSYGCEWCWKLSQICFVRSIPWKAAQIECHHLTLYISRIGGYSPYIQNFGSLQNHNPSAIITVFIFSAIHPLCNMFETRVGVRELHPPQRRWVLPRLKVAWSGQGRHRFKIIFRLDKGEMVFLPLSVKIRSRYWSHQILGASGVRFSAISAVCSIAGVVTWRLINFRLPAPFLQRC